jgi:hypothetical protein
MADSSTKWPDLAIGLYDKLTGRNAEITYEFNDVEINVPDGTGSDTQYANWKINGIVKIRTRDTTAS